MDYTTEIKDEKLRKAVIKALSKMGYKLKFCPATFTGRHHPRDETGKEGLLKHIEKVCWFLSRASEVYCYSQDEKDILLTSAFFHDLSKVERAKVVEKVIYIGEKIERITEVSRELGTEGDKHPFESAVLARKFLEAEGVDSATIGTITNIIISHMSHWYSDFPQPKTEYEKLFALADFIASMKEFKIEKAGRWEKLVSKLRKISR